MSITLNTSLSRLIIFMSLMLIGAPMAMADHDEEYDPNPPSYFVTPATGTGVAAAARNTQFLCLSAIPIAPANITLTAQTTSWVDKHNQVIPSEIPYVAGEVNWKNVPNAHPEFRTWVENGQRHFKGNGIPNHPTGVFPVQANTPAYSYYAAAPAEGYTSAAEIPIAPYDLDVTVPADPVYSETPTCINDLMTGVVTQTGAVWHANLAYAGVWVDPIAALPVDQCWGHPYNTMYHYHGFSWKCFPNQGEAHEHSPLFGYAMDGFGVYGPRGDKGDLLTNEDLDECHGHFGRIKWNGRWKNMYHYHVNNEYPYGPGCYRGAIGKTGMHIKHSHGFPSSSGLPVDSAPAKEGEGHMQH